VKLTHDPERGCRECPMCYRDTYDTRMCILAQDELPEGSLPAPAWCPLRRGPVTVEAPERET
jgi:hypothetical protein